MAGNRLIGHRLQVKNLRATTIAITTTTYDTCPKPRIKIAVGAEFGGNQAYFVAGLHGTVITKKDMIITAGCDYDGRFIPRLGIGYVIKLRR